MDTSDDLDMHLGGTTRFGFFDWPCMDSELSSIDLAPLPMKTYPSFDLPELPEPSKVCPPQGGKKHQLVPASSGPRGRPAFMRPWDDSDSEDESDTEEEEEEEEPQPVVVIDAKQQIEQIIQLVAEIKDHEARRAIEERQARLAQAAAVLKASVLDEFVRRFARVNGYVNGVIATLV